MIANKQTLAEMHDSLQRQSWIQGGANVYDTIINDNIDSRRIVSFLSRALHSICSSFFCPGVGQSVFCALVVAVVTAVKPIECLSVTVCMCEKDSLREIVMEIDYPLQ